MPSLSTGNKHRLEAECYDDAIFIGPGPTGFYQCGPKFDSCVDQVLAKVKEQSEDFFLIQSQMSVLASTGVRPDVWHYGADDHTKAVMFRTLWSMVKTMSLSHVVRNLFQQGFGGHELLGLNVA